MGGRGVKLPAHLHAPMSHNGMVFNSTQMELSEYKNTAAEDGLTRV